MGAILFPGSHKRPYAAIRIIFFYVRLFHLYSWSYFGRDMLVVLMLLLSSSAQRYPMPAKFAHTNEDCLGSLFILINCVCIVLICFFVLLNLLSVYLHKK